MSPEAFQGFIKLIELDNRAHELLIEQQHINRKREQVESQLLSITHRISTLDDTLKKLKKRINTVELEVKTVEAQEAAKRELLESAVSVKEYNAAQAELEHLEDKKSQLEENYINFWQEYQDKEVDLEKENKRLADEKKSLMQNGEELQARTAAIAEEQKKLEKASSKATHDVDEELLEEYRRLRERIPDPVVPVDRKSCSRCFFLINQSDLQHIRYYELVSCKNCFRKLYSPELASHDESH